MLSRRHDPRRQLPGGHRLDAPGPHGIDRVEEGAVEADDPKEIGEGINGQE